MIEKVLPPIVIAVEAFGDLAELYDFADEQRVVAGAVEKRRREFVTARRCAHEALQRMGIAPVPIRSGNDHAPIWPAGVVGSITHCDGYRAAAVAKGGQLASVGIDAEVNQPLPAGVADRVLRSAERAQLSALSRASHRLGWDRLFFSCKEAVYKAWYPLTGHWLDFSDVELVVDSAASQFRARVHVDVRRRDGRPAPAYFYGRYAANAQLIVTAVTVAAP